MSGTRVLCSDGKKKLCSDGKRKKDCGGCKLRNATAWVVTMHGITDCCSSTRDGRYGKLENVTSLNDVAFVVFWDSTSGDFSTWYSTYTLHVFGNPGDSTCATQTATRTGILTFLLSATEIEVDFVDGIGLTGGTGGGTVFGASGGTSVSTSDTETFTSINTSCIGHYAMGGTATLRSVCTIPTLSASSAVFTSPAGSGSFNVTTPSPTDEWFVGVNYPAVSGHRVLVGFTDPTASWITITSATSFTGNDTVTFNVAANTTGATRTANILVNKVAYSITQTG